MVVDVLEAVEHLLDILYRAVLDVVYEPQFLALGQKQSAEIVPLTLADLRLRIAKEAFLLSTFQHSTHIDAQGDVVVFQTLAQAGGVNDILVEVICGHIVARSTTQCLQDIYALQNFSHGEGTEPVEVDDTLL